MKRLACIGLLVLSLLLVVSWTAEAWYPATSWAYYNWPYAYDMEGSDWYYYNTGSIQWAYQFGLGWASFNNINPHGWWYYGSGGYAYSLINVRWYYFNPSDMPWVYQFGSGGGWGQFMYLGSGDVKVTLTWDNTSDTDLWVTEPSGEKIYFGHLTSATGGKLDRDDRDGYGPENIFWPVGGAPHGLFKVQVHHWSGGLPVNYTVKVIRDGASYTYNGTQTTSSEVDDVTTFTR
jgi:hypothetical protein